MQTYVQLRKQIFHKETKQKNTITVYVGMRKNEKKKKNKSGSFHVTDIV